MKYDLTDEEVDRMIESNKSLHIKLAVATVELEKLRKVLAGSPVFNPERAQLGTAEALQIATATVIANKDTLIELIQGAFGAPSKEHAISALGIVGRVLLSLEQMVRETPIEEVKDAMTKAQRPPDATKH